MNISTLKGQLLTVMFLLLCGISAHAEDVVTITLEKAGTLPEQIDDSKKYTITSLKVIGDINGTDLGLIRDMAGCDADSYITYGKLADLDLSDAKIVSGGDYYYDDWGTEYTTSNDVLGDFAFYMCSSLTSVKLPSGLTSIGKYAFGDCSSLASINLPSSLTSIGKYAFGDCSSLTSINLPFGLTSIGVYAFMGCI